MMCMKNEAVQVVVAGVLPIHSGAAIFIEEPSGKVFLIPIDHSTGTAIQMAMEKENAERPLTHDLMVLMIESFGATLQRVIINDYVDEIFYARLVLHADNELGQKKIVELDARPSDCIALAMRLDAPVYATRNVLDAVDDISKEVRDIISQTSR